MNQTVWCVRAMVVAVTTASAISALAGETPFRIRPRAKASVSDPGSVFSWTEDGRLQEQRDVVLKAGDTSYTIRYVKHVRPSGPQQLEREIWPLGLARAGPNAWRGDGIVGVEVNGTRVGNAQLAHLGVVRDRDRAVYDLAFDLEPAAVRIRSVVVPDSAPLLLEVLLAPQQPITGFKVMLRIRVRSTDPDNPAHQARVTTQNRRGVAAPAELDPATEHWVVLADAPDSRSPGGRIHPRAALWLPGQVARVECRDAGDDATTVEFTVRPALERFRVGLFDLSGTDSSPDLDVLTPALAEATQLLESAAFETDTLRPPVAAAAWTEHQALLKQLTDKRDYESRIAELRAATERETAFLTGTGVRAWVAQSRLSAYLVEYRVLLWDLRFAALQQ